MTIFVVGINYKTAPITIREQVYFSTEKLALYLQDLLNQGCAREAVLLSTCNRSELYCEAENIEQLIDWFCAQTSLPRDELISAIYTLRDDGAIAHLMEVACGLDSMVLGEPQILGQMKEAFSESCAADTVGPLFHRLFQQVFKLAKEIRTTTAIGACPVSVASAAAHFAKQKVADFANAKVALIGAGDTTELLARYICSHLIAPLTLVNRNLENANKLVESLGEKICAKGLDELSSVLADVDIIFSATGSALPIINKTMMANALLMRQNQPILLFDLAVPRDIDPLVAEFAGVSLYRSE